MVDLILAAFTAGTFLLGYWFGRTHGPRSAAFTRAMAWFTAFFKH